MPKVAIYPGSTDRSMPIPQLARAAVERGFSGIFLNEHTYIPVEHPRSEFPAGGAGVGWGWNREEFEDHGFLAKERAAVVREKVLLMSALWSDEVASFKGNYVRLPPSRAWPKPHQRPRPPVLLGAPASERNFARVVEWADGWLPMGSAPRNEDITAQLTALRQMWEAAGRDPADLRISAIQTPVPLATFREVIERAETLGIDRVLLHMQDESEPEALKLLDEAAAGAGLS